MCNVTQQLIYSTVCADTLTHVRIKTPVPAIVKPKPLWSGKQVIGMILSLFTANLPPLNLQGGKSRLPDSVWVGRGKGEIGRNTGEDCECSCHAHLCCSLGTVSSHVTFILC
jgi:hypothetical protein